MGEWDVVAVAPPDWSWPARELASTKTDCSKRVSIDDTADLWDDSERGSEEPRRQPSCKTGPVELAPGWEFEGGRVEIEPSDGNMVGSMTPSQRASMKATNMLFAKALDTLKQEDRDKTERSKRGCFPTLDAMIMPPTAPLNVAWDMLFATFVVYDFFAVPLLLFDPAESELTMVIGWLARVFWTLSIPRNFLTGFMLLNGHAEVRACHVARRYASSWLVFDIIVVLSDWSEVFFNMEDTVSSVKLLKTFRALRLVRILRLVQVTKAPDCVIKAVAYLFSERTILLLDILKVAAIYVGICHYTACGWYGVGILGSSSHSWVIWHGLDQDVETMSSRYALAVNWAASNFIGNTDVYAKNPTERAFAALTLILCFLLSGCMTARLTASLTRLHILDGMHEVALANLRTFLHDRSISPDLAMRAMACANHVIVSKKKARTEQDIDLFPHIDDDLRTEIHAEIHLPFLTPHAFFRTYWRCDHRAVQRVCHGAVATRVFARGDRLCCQGQRVTTPCMYILVSGVLLYLSEQDAETGDGNVHQLKERRWACEPAMWIHEWVYCGSLRAAGTCSVLEISAESLRRISMEGGESDYPATYARAFVDQMNMSREEGKSIDDLNPGFDVQDLAHVVLSRQRPSLMRITLKKQVSLLDKARNPLARIGSSNLSLS